MNRTVSVIEYKRVVQKALDLGLNNAFIQDDSSADEIFVPPFGDAEKNLLNKANKDF